MKAERLSPPANVIGSGLLARAFLPWVSGTQNAACVYAAGVSNSGCSDRQEFERERQRLKEALKQFFGADPFVYFGTCSVADPEAQQTPYVQHKLAMEGWVQTHPRPLIFRLPQVVGKTPNPHTLLNFLYARIVRSERFVVWRGARRNVIDVDDVAAIAWQWMAEGSVRNRILNIANPVSNSILDIVRAMECVVGKPAIYDLVDNGSAYRIEGSESARAAERAGVRFSKDYLHRVIRKYYGSPQ